MDDKVMYAWQVVGNYSEYVHFTCSRKETAAYIRDWLNAIEENMWRDIAKSIGTEYNQFDEQIFSIQECEVIL